jgi:excisionase family DNA binding protein
MTSPLLTIQQALERLPVCERTLRTLVRNREIGFGRIGKRLYFKESDIEAYLESRHTPPRKGKAA